MAANPNTELDFCADVCRSTDEPLYGTATRADVWLLLEYSGRWGRKALPESALPPAIKDRLITYEEAHDTTRVKFIKKAPPYESDRIQFFIAVSNEAEPRLYRFDLDHYENLLSIDFDSVVAGDEAYDANRLYDALYLTCTNGLRDACCARYGLDTFYAFEEAVGDAIWQSTHLGGHRFAPISLVLPYALHYGQIKPEEAAEVVRATQRGEVYPSRYRGRTTVEKPVQAAEHFLRAETGDNHIDAYELASMESVDENMWQVALRARDGVLHTVRVEAVPFEQQVRKSCADDFFSTVTRFELVSHEVSDPAD